MFGVMSSPHFGHKQKVCGHKIIKSILRNATSCLITLSARATTFGGIVRAICFAVPRPAGGIFPFTIGMASSNYAADTIFNFRTEGGDT